MKRRTRELSPKLGLHGPAYTKNYGNIGGSYWTRSADITSQKGLQEKYRIDGFVKRHRSMASPLLIYEWPLNSLGHESICTTSGRRKALDGRPQVNPVDHTRVQLVNVDWGVYRTKNHNRYHPRYRHLCSFQMYYGRTQKLTDEIPESFGHLDLHLPDDLRNMRAKAYYSMQPRFQGNVDCLLFLAEMTEIKGLMKQFFRTSPKKLYNMIKALSGHGRKRDLDPTRPAAESHLAIEFGLKPLVSEVMAILEDLKSTIDEVQQQFAEAGASHQTSYYTEKYKKVTEIPSRMEAADMSPYASGTDDYHLYTASMSYKYNYSLRSFYEAAVKYYGLDLSFSTIYEGMPFSFLIDYFLTLGRSIRFMELDNNVKLMEPVFCESIKHIHRTGLIIQATDHLSESELPLQSTIVNNEVYDSLAQPLFVSGVSGTRYRRRRIHIPAGTFGTIIPEWTDGLSDGQKTNCAALLRTFMF